MAAPREEADVMFDVPVYRKQLVGTANSDNLLNAFDVIVSELMGDKMIALGTPAGGEVSDTFEFVAYGHVFTVSVEPVR